MVNGGGCVLILVTDANILITLFDVNGVSVLPMIAPTEVLDVVLSECEHESQRGLKEAVAAAGIRVVSTELAWAAPARLLMNGQLSFPDALCLYYAKHHGRVLLSGDRPLRNRCVAEGVDYRGVIWIVHEAHARELIQPQELCRWIKTWPLMDRRLPVDELEKLRRELNC
jgi:hypothetical protein